MTTQPSTQQSPGRRPLRADALKNRTRILQAAESVFATEGVAVPIDLVAAQAGVGIGTVYRHFPTKEDLFEAIVASRLDDLLATGNRLLKAPEPGAALFSFLREFARQAGAKRDLLDTLSSAGIDVKARCAEKIEQVESLIDQLRLRAVGQGSVRPDVSADELIGLAVGTSFALGRSVSGLDIDRMLEIIFDGLRTKDTSAGDV
jgi:AcrR family transcriptional regulator